MAARAPLVQYLLRLGDNCLILGHRLSEWCGHGPTIEEELALANVGLDLIGQAQMWLNLAGETEGKKRTADKLAYLRDAGEFRNLLLVEQPNGDFAHTMMRQFYFDAWHHLLLQKLRESNNRKMADIAEKAAKEVSYHLERSGDWVVRLGDGTRESHDRIQAAADNLWMFTGECFEEEETDKAPGGDGIVPRADDLRKPWRESVGEVFSEATLRVPESEWMQKGGYRGVHTEHLGHILSEMQFLQRAYPNADW